MKNYSVTFKSLRAGTVYTVHIGGGTGAEVPLKGGAQPFTTQEDDDEDMFTPIRTQSGYLRIVDDGFAEDGVTAFDWKDLIPQTNTGRPVTLTHVENGQSLTDWQGYMQAQTFSGEIYGGTQIREFPVQCGISALVGASIATNYVLCNFAYAIASLIGSGIGYDRYFFQGVDAQLWLINKIDWNNFMHTIEGVIVPRYHALDVLTDICRFWGWTCRTRGRNVYFSCMDDSYESGTWISFTSSQMLSLTNDTVGITSSTPTVALSGDIFASTLNDETYIQGIKSATVNVDVNEEDTVVKFAPADIENQLGNPSTWVQQPDEDMVGYFKTPRQAYLNGNTMTAYTGVSNCGFERRIIFPSADAEQGTHVDAMLIRRDYVAVDGVGSVIISLQTKQAMAFGGGSLGITGTLYNAAHLLDETDPSAAISVRIGIGLTTQTAKWFYLYDEANDLPTFQIYSGWDGDSTNEFLMNVNGSRIAGVKIAHRVTHLYYSAYTFPQIPVDANLYGYLYVDILGSSSFQNPYEIADFCVTFTRDSTTLPTSSTDVRARIIVPELTTTKSYKSSNSSDYENDVYIDCIFASDNNLAYGRGIILNTLGGFLDLVRYGEGFEHPEQHLANRISSYGRKTRRMLSCELRSDASNVGDIQPTAKVSIDGQTYGTISISNNWREEVTTVKMIELWS